MINDLSQKSYFQGVCLSDSFTSAIRPPKKWARVINGLRITPKLIHSTLLKCHEAGCDMEFIAQKLDVGVGAIREYISNEKSIPYEVAERFHRLFTSGASLPKAAPQTPSSAPIAEDEIKCKPKKFSSPDVAAERLGKAFVAEREKRGWTQYQVSRKLKATENNIRRAEEGKILWITVKTSLLYRLCKLYGLDIRDYETKKRINFRLFQKKIRAVKEKRGASWDAIADNCGISRSMVSNFNTGKSRQLAVYLTPQMIQLMEYLGIDPQSVVLEREKEE